MTPGAGLNVISSTVVSATTGSSGGQGRSFVLFQRFDLNGQKYVLANGYCAGAIQIPSGYRPNGIVFFEGGTISAGGIIPEGQVNAIWATD